MDRHLFEVSVTVIMFPTYFCLYITCQNRLDTDQQTIKTINSYRVRLILGLSKDLLLLSFEMLSVVLF